MPTRTAPSEESKSAVMKDQIVKQVSNAADPRYHRLAACPWVRHAIGKRARKVTRQSSRWPSRLESSWGRKVGLAHDEGSRREILDELGVGYETKIVSAHRTPDRLWDYGKAAPGAG